MSKVSLIFLKVISLKNVDWQLSGEIQTDPSLWFQFVFGCPLNCKTKTGFLLRQILLSAAQQKFPKGPSIKEVRIFWSFLIPSPPMGSFENYVDKMRWVGGRDIHIECSKQFKETYTFMGLGRAGRFGQS